MQTEQAPRNILGVASKTGQRAVSGIPDSEVNLVVLLAALILVQHDFQNYPMRMEQGSHLTLMIATSLLQMHFHIT